MTKEPTEMRKKGRLVVNFAKSEATMRMFIERRMPKGRKVELARKRKRATGNGYAVMKNFLKKRRDYLRITRLELDIECRLDPNGRPTVNSTLVWAQEFVPFRQIAVPEYQTRIFHLYSSATTGLLRLTPNVEL